MAEKKHEQPTQPGLTTLAMFAQVRDVAWAPEIGSALSTLVTCSQENILLVFVHAHSLIPKAIDCVCRTGRLLSGHMCPPTKAGLIRSRYDSKVSKYGRGCVQASEKYATGRAIGDFRSSCSDVRYGASRGLSLAISLRFLVATTWRVNKYYRLSWLVVCRYVRPSQHCRLLCGSKMCQISGSKWDSLQMLPLPVDENARNLTTLICS